MGLKAATFDPWETLVHNDTIEQCVPSSESPQRATVERRSYNLSWIHHSLKTALLLCRRVSWAHPSEVIDVIAGFYLWKKYINCRKYTSV